MHSHELQGLAGSPGAAAQHEWRRWLTPFSPMWLPLEAAGRPAGPAATGLHLGYSTPTRLSSSGRTSSTTCMPEARRHLVSNPLMTRCGRQQGCAPAQMQATRQANQLLQNARQSQLMHCIAMAQPAQHLHHWHAPALAWQSCWRCSRRRLVSSTVRFSCCSALTEENVSTCSGAHQGSNGSAC